MEQPGNDDTFYFFYFFIFATTNNLNTVDISKEKDKLNTRTAVTGNTFLSRVQ